VDKVEANYDCDWLSRSKLDKVRNRYPEELLSTVETDPWITRVLDVINPELSFRDGVSILSCWRDIDERVKEVSLVGENVTELPIFNSDESLLQIFVSCKDQGLKNEYMGGVWVLL
jgi:hypothetical protein